MFIPKRAEAPNRQEFLGIVSMNVGQAITPIRLINPVMTANWKYAKENGSILGGLMQGTELQIVALSKIPGQMWIQFVIPGRDPPVSMKISGEEFSMNFRLIGYSFSDN